MFVYTILYTISKNSCPMSLNVQGIRRFDRPDKRTRSVSRAGKLWRRKTPQRAFQRLSARPAGVFRSPSRPTGRRSVYRLLNAVLLLLFCLFHNVFIENFYRPRRRRVILYANRHLSLVLSWKHTKNFSRLRRSRMILPVIRRYLSE